MKMKRHNWIVRVTRKTLLLIAIFVVALLYFFFQQTPIVANAAEKKTINEVGLTFWYSNEIECDVSNGNVDIKISGTRDKVRSWTKITIRLKADKGYEFDEEMKDRSAWDLGVNDNKKLHVRFDKVSKFDEDEIRIKVEYYIDYDNRRYRSYTNNRSRWAIENGSWCYYEDGSKVRNDWRQVDGYWYYFGANGQMRKGFIDSVDYTYYLNEWPSDGFPEGAMVTRWKFINGIWYYFDPKGPMVRGWKNINGIWFYFDSNGRMQCNTWVRGTCYWYYLDANGRMVTGYKFVDGQWHNFLESGVYIGGCTTREY